MIAHSSDCGRIHCEPLENHAWLLAPERGRFPGSQEGSLLRGEPEMEGERCQIERFERPFGEIVVFGLEEGVDEVSSRELIESGIPFEFGSGGTACEESWFAFVSSNRALKLIQFAALQQIGEIMGKEIVPFEDIGVAFTDQIDEPAQNLLLSQFPSIEYLFPAGVVGECNGKDPILGLSRVAD